MKKKKLVVMGREEYEVLRASALAMVRSRMSFQQQRKALDNRLGRKADGTPQDEEKLPRREIIPGIRPVLIRASDASKEWERAFEAAIMKVVRKMPIRYWLEDVKGLGPVGMGVICGYFHIFRADAASNMTQYAGLNSDMVRGYKSRRVDGKRVWVRTEDRIRGDRCTKGYRCPYNADLRTALMGVVADKFIWYKNRYALDFYYPRKHRMQNSERKVWHKRSTNSKWELLPWKDVSDGHRHNDAKRFMMKHFLIELYAAWRPLHGLPVRAPYAEERLSIIHNDPARRVPTLCPGTVLSEHGYALLDEQGDDLIDDQGDDQGDDNAGSLVLV